MKRSESIDLDQSTAGTVSRRQLLAAGVAVSAATAGCSDVTGLLSASQPACDGEQREPQGDPQLGDESAAVTVEVYEDFACSHCAEYNKTVAPAIKADYVEPGDALYVHHDFLIPINEWSWKAANAAREVQRAAGDETFFEYIALVFENYRDYSESLLASLAGDVGVDESAVEEAIANRPYCEFLGSAREKATDQGVEKTPTVFVEGEKMVGPSESDLREAIESHL